MWTYQITDGVHAKDSFIFLQLWALGRTARPENLKGEPQLAPSPIKLSTAPKDQPNPQEMTIEQIKEFVGLYAHAAKQAIAAGLEHAEMAVHMAQLVSSLWLIFCGYVCTCYRRPRFPCHTSY